MQTNFLVISYHTRASTNYRKVYQVFIVSRNYFVFNVYLCLLGWIFRHSLNRATECIFLCEIYLYLNNMIWTNKQYLWWENVFWTFLALHYKNKSIWKTSIYFADAGRNNRIPGICIFEHISHTKVIYQLNVIDPYLIFPASLYTYILW